MKKNIIIVSIVFLVLAGFFIWGKAIQKPNTITPSKGQSGIIAKEKFFDFGSISMKNGLVTKEFIITNPTDRDIFVSSLETSCMCTKAYIVKGDGTTKGPFSMPGMGYNPPADETIKAGENKIIRVIYDPNAHGPAGVGLIDRFVTLTDESGKTLSLEIKANVTP